MYARHDRVADRVPNADKLDDSPARAKHRAMAGKRRRFREAQIEAALRATHGNQSAAAKALEEATGVPVSRQSIHDRVRKSPRLRQVIFDADEQMIDLD